MSAASATDPTGWTVSVSDVIAAGRRPIDALGRDHVHVHPVRHHVVNAGRHEILDLGRVLRSDDVTGLDACSGGGGEKTYAQDERADNRKLRRENQVRLLVRRPPHPVRKLDVYDSRLPVRIHHLSAFRTETARSSGMKIFWLLHFGSN